MIVPSRTRCSGPAALIGGRVVRRAPLRRRPAARGSVAAGVAGSLALPARSSRRTGASWRSLGPPRRRRRRRTDRRAWLRGHAAAASSPVGPLIRSLALRPPAEHDVAGEQALVLARVRVSARSDPAARAPALGVVGASAAAGAGGRRLRFAAAPAPRAPAGGPDSRARDRRSAPAAVPAAVRGP